MAGMTLNKDKCMFNKKQVEFLGYKISEKGIHAGDKIQGVVGFPTPDCVKVVRSFLGLINQYAGFSPEISKVSQPIRDLLKKDVSWIWDAAQELSLKNLKDLFEKPPILAHFDSKNKTVITTDESNQSIGAILSQIDKEGKRRIVAAASRSLLSAEKNYAVIEKKALGWSRRINIIEDIILLL